MADPLADLEPALRPYVQRESSGQPYVGYTAPSTFKAQGGLTDLSMAPLDETGFPIWSGDIGPSGRSHAAGILQIEPGTWRPVAKELGVTDFSLPSQIKVANAIYAKQGLAPWTTQAGLAPIGGNALTGNSVRVANGSLGPQLTALGASLMARANPLTQPSAAPNATATAAVPLASDPIRLMQALQLTQLMAAGTHSVQPVDYDPFKLEPHADGAVAVAAPTPDIRRPSTVSGEPKVQAVDAVGGTSPGQTPGYLTFLGSRQFWGPQQGIEGQGETDG